MKKRIAAGTAMAALALTISLRLWTSAAAQGNPTPRLPGGHPDLTGYWTTPGEGGSGLIESAASVSADGKTIQLGIANETKLCDRAKARFRTRAAKTELRPSYKPEYVEKAKALLTGPQYLDPAFRCLPIGVPRMGPPQEIVQTPAAMYFLYATQQRNVYRVIPTDGRPHDSEADYMPMGDSIGRWEGDTLVVDVTKLSDDTWLDGDGSFHSKEMHVVERFTREGNTLHYEVVVEDSELFTKPWRPDERTLILGKSGEHVKEDYACVEHSSENMVNTDRH